MEYGKEMGMIQMMTTNVCTLNSFAPVTPVANDQ